MLEIIRKPKIVSILQHKLSPIILSGKQSVNRKDHLMGDVQGILLLDEKPTFKYLEFYHLSYYLDNHWTGGFFLNIQKFIIYLNILIFIGSEATFKYFEFFHIS